MLMAEICKWTTLLRSYAAGKLVGETYGDHLSYSFIDDRVEIVLEFYQDRVYLIIRALDVPFNPRNQYDDFSCITVSSYEHLCILLANYNLIRHYTLAS